MQNLDAPPPAWNERRWWFFKRTKKNEIGIRTFFGPLAFAWTENATLLDAVVVFATETFAPTNVDEVKAADMFVIIKLFFVRVCLWRIRESSKRTLAPQNALQKEERFSSKRRDRSFDPRKNCKKTRKKKQEIFIRREDRRAFDCKSTTVCSRTHHHSSFLV